jgi:hypothetical protein
MPRYLIRSFVMVYYDHDIEADTLEDAVQLVEHGEDDGVERDNSAPVAYEYAVGDDWREIPDETPQGKTKYCSVCNAPVTDWDKDYGYGECQNGHFVQAALCLDEPKTPRSVGHGTAMPQKGD